MKFMKENDILDIKLKEIKKRLNKLEDEYAKTIDEMGKGDKEIEAELKKIRKQKFVILTKLAENKAKLILKIKQEKLNKLARKTPKIKNLKIKYTAKTGRYDFIFEQFDYKNDSWNQKIKIYTVDKEKLDDTNKNNVFVAKNIGFSEYNKLDMNLIDSLKSFDLEMDTHLYDEYMSNNRSYDIVYDMKGTNKNLSKKENKKMRNIAKQQLMFRDANIKRYPKKIAVAIAGFSLAGLLSLNSFGAKPPIKNTNSGKKTNYQTSNIINIEEENNDIKVDTPVTKKDLKATKLNTIRMSNSMDNTELNAQNIDNNSYSTIYKSNDNKSNCAYYKISKIAIFNGNSVIDVMKVNDQEKINFKEIKEKYIKDFGDNIKLSVNVNGYNKNGRMVRNDIGWTSVDTLIKENNVKLVKTLV